MDGGEWIAAYRRESRYRQRLIIWAKSLPSAMKSFARPDYRGDSFKLAQSSGERPEATSCLSAGPFLWMKSVRSQRTSQKVDLAHPARWLSMVIWRI